MISRTLWSIWTWLVLVVAVIVITPMVAIIRLVTMPFDPGAYHAGRMFRQIGVVTEKLSPLWTFTVTGEVPDDPRRPYVVVANHESFVDILLLCHVPMETKWMSKSDFFRYPLVGWCMQMVGDIRLVRDDKKSGIAALQASLDRLDKKVSVMIFPEGTRSQTGELQEFKTGAARLAVQAGVPILPIAVIGTRDALVKHDWRFGRSHAEARILPPIDTAGMTKHDVDELTSRAHEAIAAALDDMRDERGLPPLGVVAS